MYCVFIIFFIYILCNFNINKNTERSIKKLIDFISNKNKEKKLCVKARRKKEHNIPNASAMGNKIYFVITQKL